jgi:hypothetical protein
MQVLKGIVTQDEFGSFPKISPALFAVLVASLQKT